MSLFTPVSGLAGGSLIGLAASTLLVANGDILGFSGIISSVTTCTTPVAIQQAFSSKNQQWKIVFVSSFLITSHLFANFAPEFLTTNANDAVHVASQGHSISDIGYALAGFLVGFGTKLGNGCTSGHGICGLARFSIRSLAAVLTFMATGIITTTFILPSLTTNNVLLIGTKEHEATFYPTKGSMLFSHVNTVVAGLIAGSIVLLQSKKTRRKNKTTDDATAASSLILEQKKQIIQKKKLLVAAFCGSLSSIGLAISGMIHREKVLGFLDMKGFQRGEYDPTLIMVMGGGLVVSAFGYHWVKGFSYFGNEKALTCPLVGGDDASADADSDVIQFNVPTNKRIDAKLVLGSALFGIGWGLAGICPGPALYLAAAGFPKVLIYWWPSNIVGSVIAKQF